MPSHVRIGWAALAALTVASGRIVVRSVAELRQLVATASARTAERVSSLSVQLEEGALLPLDGEPIIIDGFSLTLSAAGSGATIDALGLSRAFVVSQGGHLALHQVNLTRGFARWTNDFHGGGCILVLDGCRLTLNATHLSHCVADGRGNTPGAGRIIPNARGGGISAQGSVVHVAASTISDCTAIDGGAIFLKGGSFLAEGSAFHNCTSEREAGCLALLGEVRAVVKGSLLSGCECGEGGGGIFAADGSQLLLDTVRVVSSVAGRDGGALALLDASAYLRRSVISRCKAGVKGGGIWLGGSNLALHDVEMSECEADERGGGLFLEMGEVHISHSTFKSCSAWERGGGLALRGGSVHMNHSAIVACTCTHDAGGVSVGSSSTITMYASSIRECSVTEVRGLGSAMLIEQNGLALLENSTVERCHSEMYGTLYVEGNLTLLGGSEVRDCIARDAGISGAAEDSRRGGVLWVRRGGIVRLLRSTISNCTVLDLSTPQTFFAVASVDYRGTLEVFHSSFRNNTIESVTNDGASAVFVHRGGVLTSVGFDLELACGVEVVKAIQTESIVQTRLPPAAPPMNVHRSLSVDIFGTSFEFSQPTGYAEPRVDLFQFRASVAHGCGRHWTDAQILEAAIGSGRLLQTCASADDICGPLARCRDEAVVPPHSAGELALKLVSESGPRLLGRPADDRNTTSDVMPFVTSPVCDCMPPNTPSIGAPETSLSPYFLEYGCATPRRPSDITVLEHESGAQIAHVVLSLTKTFHNERQSVALQMHMSGTQQSHAIWTVERSSIPTYLTVTPLSGFISRDTRSAAFITIDATSEGMPESLEPYSATLNVSVRSASHVDTLILPIYTMIATTSDAAKSMWGRLEPSGRCIPTMHKEPLRLIVDESAAPQLVYFTACDHEGLVVQHALPSSRTAAAIAASPRQYKVTMHCEMSGAQDELLYKYESGGTYSVPIFSRRFEGQTGQFRLVLELDDQPCGCPMTGAKRRLFGPPGDKPAGCAELTVNFVCPEGLVETADRRCGCRSIWYETKGGVCVPKMLPLLLASIGTFACLLVISTLCFLARRAYRNRQLALAAAARERREQRRRVLGAMTNVTALKFPLCVMRLSRFERYGRFVSYEEARNAGALHCCDSWEEASNFSSTCTLIFVSHQWLSRTSPDPQVVHYPRVVRAAQTLCAQQGIDPETVCIWLDYHSIPQHNEATKALAIGSIALYASFTSFFLVCAPETIHLDSGATCDAETYLARGWCRLEQWAFMTANGTDCMYHCGSEVVEDKLRLLPIADVSRWVERSIKVFSGDFTCESDKELLVDVVLGMYGLAYLSVLQREASTLSTTHAHRITLGVNRRKTVLQGALMGELQAADKATIFPPELFGELVELLEVELEASLGKVASSKEIWNCREPVRRHTKAKSFIAFMVSSSDSSKSKDSHGEPSLTRHHSYSLFDKDSFEAVLQASSHLNKQRAVPMSTSGTQLPVVSLESMVLTDCASHASYDDRGSRNDGGAEGNTSCSPKLMVTISV